MKKKKDKLKAAKRKRSSHDEHGYYRYEGEPELPKRWWDIPLLPMHRREFLQRKVAEILDRGEMSSATNIMHTDFVKLMAENHQLRIANRKLRKKLGRKT